MNQSFFRRTFFHSALAILEPQIYIVVEQFGAENTSQISGRLVYKFYKISNVVPEESYLMKMMIIPIKQCSH